MNKIEGTTENRVTPIAEDAADASKQQRRLPRVDPGTLRTALVALGALAIGVLIGATSWRTPDPAAPEPDVGSTFPTDGLGAALESPDTTTTSTSTAPSTTVRVTTTSGPTLAVLAPVMGGRSIVGKFQSGAFKWSGSQPEPQVVARGSDSEGVWDPTGRFLAVAKRFGTDGWGELWTVSAGGSYPLHLDVSSFSWHPSEPSLAFFARQVADGPRAIYIADVASVSGSRVVETVPLPQDVAAEDSYLWLAGWGDWGLVVVVTDCPGSDACSNEVVSLGRTGELVSRLPLPSNTNLASVSPSGQVLLVESDGEHGLSHSPRWTDPSLADLTPADMPPNTDYWSIRWSPDGTRYIRQSWDDSGATMVLVDTATGEETEVRGFDWVEGFSSDGVLLIGHPSGLSQRSLLIVDLRDDSRYQLTLPWDSWDVRIGNR